MTLVLPDDIRQYLISVDPVLRRLFSEVDAQFLSPSGEQPKKTGRSLNFLSLRKDPLVALIGAIVGQRIAYSAAKEIRSKIYSILGTDFTISDLDRLLISGILPEPSQGTVQNLQKFLHQRNITDTMLNEFSFDWNCLLEIPGIGPWTIATARLTSFRYLRWVGLWPLGSLSSE